MLPPSETASRDQTRRHFFSQCGMGIGSVALASLMAERGLHAASAAAAPGPGIMKKGDVTPRAKNVIYLFMAGGPSQLELFDYKPRLVELNGQPIPQSYIEGKALCLHGHQQRFQAPRHPSRIPAARPERRLDERHAALHAGRGR